MIIFQSELLSINFPSEVFGVTCLFFRTGTIFFEAEDFIDVVAVFLAVFLFYPFAGFFVLIFVPTVFVNHFPVTDNQFVGISLDTFIIITARCKTKA